jgi:hypothetical protein
VADPLCIVVGAKTVMLAAAAFTLSWTHSVEKTSWQEDWRLGASGLELVEARIKGSGAGMEPPADAVLANGWWTYRPALPPQPSLNLAASGATSGGWTLCVADLCMELGAAPGEGVVIAPCP